MAVNELCIKGPPQRPSVQHSQAYKLQPCPHLGQFQDLRNTFLFVLPIVFVILGWLIVFLTSNEKHNMGTQCSPRGHGHQLWLASVQLLWRSLPSSACCLDLRDPFLSVSHNSQHRHRHYYLDVYWLALSLHSVKSSSRKNFHNDKDICS